MSRQQLLHLQWQLLARFTRAIDHAVQSEVAKPDPVPSAVPSVPHTVQASEVEPAGASEQEKALIAERAQ